MIYVYLLWLTLCFFIDSIDYLHTNLDIMIIFVIRSCNIFNKYNAKFVKKEKF
jgi:hypothetical protein